jgi:glucose-1-phosphate cytidylyltransferase
MIKEYFANYCLHMSDVTFDMSTGKMQVHRQRAEPWSVTLVDTGDDSMTGGRLKRVRKYVENETEFFFTYGDGVADVDITATLAFHRAHGRAATLTATVPPGRFGAIQMIGAEITAFTEKPRGDGGLINGGFFVLRPSVISEIEDDKTIWEQAPLQNLAKSGQLMAYEHHGFWQPMDTLRDKQYLEQLWQSGKAPWKTWDCSDAC